jgi:NAD(P)-dependent dehydrogenase (short-subunit alcohol dehydrogenase family)
MGNFGSLDGIVNNTGIFFTKPFTDYTSNDFEPLSEYRGLHLHHPTLE